MQTSRDAEKGSILHGGLSADVARHCDCLSLRMGHAEPINQKESETLETVRPAGKAETCRGMFYTKTVYNKRTCAESD